MSRAQMLSELNRLGETPPKAWTNAEMKLRLEELQYDLGMDTKKGKEHSPLRQMIIELNRAKKEKKESLKWHVSQNLKVPLSGNETIENLMSKGLQAIYDLAESSETDPVGFGVHAAKTCGDILVEEKGYAKWVVTTAREDPHNCSPRLIRLAKWLHNMEQQNMNPRAQAVSYHQKESKEKIITMTETGMTSADTKQMPSSSNDAMIQMMQQLMTTVSQLGEEVQDLKAERPHKKEGKAVSEVTSGSFEMMQQ